MNEEAIFAAALDKKTARERQEYLDQACAGNAELRAQIEELLRADSDAGSFLQKPPMPLDATVASGETARDSSDASGWLSRLSFLQPCAKPDRLGKLSGKVGEYEIIEIVGHGGMGAVLRAFDTKLSRVVAVKVMAPELAANPVAVKRFLREATTAAAVHHDHVVTIHAVDDSHQPPYLVMQFVEGQTLQEKIDREGALELKHILRIGSQAAAGLAAAHKTGLIHRDVKPSNILLENGVERVKISDFGLARAADDVQVTQTGIIAGTPQYMSPEQAKGEPIDARGDLFSLGSVLYTMCTGRPAFRADNPVAVLRRVCDDTPRPIHEINPEIPQWLCEIVDKLLEKKPEDRFQSAQEVGELLAQHLAHLQQPASCPMPPRLPVAKSAPVADKNWLASEIRLYRATAIMSLAAFVLAVFVATFARGEFPAPLAGWFFWGGMISLFVGLAILFAAQQAEARQSYNWAIAAACLSLLPINPFLIFCIPVTVWSLYTVLRAGGQSRLSLGGELKKPPAAASSGEARPVPPIWVLGGGLVFAIVAMVGFILKEVSLVSGRALGLSLTILITTWLIALAVWLYTQHRQWTRASREYSSTAKPPKLTPSGVLVEHPVLGLFAVVMLIASASIATYMLTAAVHHMRGRETATVSDSGAVVLPANPESITNPVDLTTWGKFIDPRGDCHLTRNKDSVTLTVPGNPPHSLGPDRNYDAPRLVEEIEGDFVMEVSMPPYQRSKAGTSVRGDRVSYKMAGLLVWIDEKNLLRFEISSWGEQRAGAPFLHAGWVQSGRTAGDEGLILGATAAPIHFRIARRGAELQLSWSHDRQNWMLWKTVQNMNLPNRVSCGVQAGNCTSDAVTVVFERLAITTAPPPGANAGSPSSASPPPPAIAPFDAEQARSHQQAWANHLGMPVEITNALGMKLRLIPPGKGVAHPSGLSQSTEPFFHGTTEVTVGQFRRFVDETSYQTAGEKNGLGGGKLQSPNRTERKADYVWKHPDFTASNDHPVALVTWHDAAAFCDWLSKKEGRTYRLPTSDEWNWAARAGSAARFYFGDSVSELDAHAWHLDIAGNHTHPTGNKLPNSWGLFDIYGNVWELSYDFERGGKSFKPGQPSDGPQSVERIYFWGGSFNNGPATLTNRGNGSSAIGYSHTGFRVALVGILKASTAATDDWVQLFNGKDLTGWKTLPEQPGTWKVEDGVLVGRGGISHLFSDKIYGDFQLVVEARLIRGDSGIFFRSELSLPKVSKITGLRYPTGYEAEIVDPKSDHGRGNTGSIRPLALTLDDLVPLGEWFNIEVIADGNHLVTKVNGRIAADVHDSAREFTSGHLVLGCGGSGLSTIVQFRKIEVKELSSDSTNQSNKP